MSSGLDGGRTPARTVLVGRVEECAVIDRLLAHAGRGSSATLVLSGASGIGKSPLLDDAAGAAVDFGVVRLAGSESEMAFAWAVVHQLVIPPLDQVTELPCQAPALVSGRR